MNITYHKNNSIYLTNVSYKPFEDKNIKIEVICINAVELITIKSLLKKKHIKAINNAVGFLSSSYINNEEDLLAYQKKLQNIRGDLFNDYDSIIIDNHTLERWNERVGPITDFSTLQNVLNRIFLNHSYRVRKIAGDIGTIDGDIVFTYVEKDRKLIITTFYGRKSLRPVLNQMESLRIYNLVNKEFVELSLAENEVMNQELPILPREVIEFSGRTREYCIEKYLMRNQKQPVVFCYLDNKIIRLINLGEIPHVKTVPKIVLFILYKDGYSSFVMEYFKHHHPTRVEKAKNYAMKYINRNKT
jgi:hypothetical protein